jgi:hypothetical protein
LLQLTNDPSANTSFNYTTETKRPGSALTALPGPFGGVTRAAVVRHYRIKHNAVIVKPLNLKKTAQSARKPEHDGERRRCATPNQLLTTLTILIRNVELPAASGQRPIETQQGTIKVKAITKDDFPLAVRPPTLNNSYEVVGRSPTNVERYEVFRVSPDQRV